MGNNYFSMNCKYRDTISIDKNIKQSGVFINSRFPDLLIGNNELSVYKLRNDINRPDFASFASSCINFPFLLVSHSLYLNPLPRER